MGINKMTKTTSAIADNGRGKVSQTSPNIEKPFIIIQGKKVHYKHLNANTFLDYEARKQQQNVKLANEWLIGEAYGYDFDFSQYKFRDRGRLLVGLTQATVDYLDDQPLDQTSHFRVEGNEFKEREDSGDSFDLFAVQQQSGDPRAAYSRVARGALLINNEPIEDLHFELSANQGGIGFKGMAIIKQWSLAFLE